MHRIATAFAALAMVGVMSAPAAADPPRHADKSAKHHEKHWLKSERYVGFGGGPPPWAPAHGYRRKAGYYDNSGYRDYGLKAPPIDLAARRCNSDVIGQLIGGGIGALAGAQIGKGEGRLAAVAAGTILGVLVGGEVGRSMDRVDALCVDQALETAPDGQTIVWNSERRDYAVTPTHTVANADGQYCREYTAKSTVGGETVQTYGIACRQPDGAWKLVSRNG